jgi:hypothetical protein
VSRRWEHLLIERLRAAGYGISVVTLDLPKEPNGAALDRALALGGRRAGPSLAARAEPFPAAVREPAGLVIDLTGESRVAPAPMLRLEFMGRSSIGDGLATMLATGALPELVARIDGVAVGRAAPMLDDRLWLGRLANAVLPAAISLILRTVAAFFDKRLKPIEVDAVSGSPAPNLMRVYLPHLIAGLAGRARSKLLGGAQVHWRVAYRQTDGVGVAETMRLDGAAFTVLPDDGKRFYADPFLIERNGRTFLFVEEFPYASHKGVIAVSELGADGRFGVPHVVLEESHHLSYPQILVDGDDVFMLPEGSGGRELVLYRAVGFPNRWVRDTVLLSDTNINDATLLVRDGRYWLIGTERVDVGSASDTMVIYSAPALRGPWTPHALNPIVIDRAAARPGGAFIRQNGRVVLPVQDGTHEYGGGLGLMDLIRLNDREAVWGPVRPIGAGTAWNRRGIHTLNRLGTLEVIDSVA